MSHPAVVSVGASGQLGQALAARGVSGFTRRDLDITDRHAVLADEKIAAADVLINCAAYTAVDAAESDPEGAFAVNEEGAANLAEACARSGTFLVHLSTDYVFGGGARREAWHVDDPTDPETVYGRSKLAGEQAVRQSSADAAIVRTAWVWNGHEKDFVSTMLRLERERDTLNVVDDQWGNPTWVSDLADGLMEFSTRPIPGTFHLTGTGAATWFDFAQEVFEVVGADPGRVLPCTTADYPTPAPRPAWSVLDASAWVDAGFTPLPEWRSSLRRGLA
ncbi:dTDP-4-dehydrorhamnose reductase [Corynebacterium sputi]|uniref:dTDP-4-dehydrorhamnose reductase n=1 Tax=Corynebacterium sputi TaxID=489915 RepID=UPI0003F5231E|nr:dTDP-4-dehydrorhamnose reductase [Corynebacterium sputi]